ncbi:MAG: alpha/beta hydrolase, partial [Marinoscillum sp.]
MKSKAQSIAVSGLWIHTVCVFTVLALTSFVCAGQKTPVGKYAEINGLKMYYEVSGQGDPLIVLHGAYMDIPSMGSIIPKLAETHKVYALEFQGHGRTADIDRPITYQNLADDVAALMETLDIDSADVFGYSMGSAAG